MPFRSLGWGVVSLFDFQQAFFAPEAAAVTGEGAVGSDDAVAGDQNRDAVIAVGAGHGSDCGGLPDDLSLFGIGTGGATRNGPQGVPDSFLKLGSRQDQGEIEVGPFTGEVSLKLAVEFWEPGAVAGERAGVESFLQAVELRFEHPAIGEFEQADPLLRRAGQHRPQGGQQATDVDHLLLITSGGRVAHRFFKTLAEPAQRFVAAVEGSVGYRGFVLQLAEGLVDPPHPQVGGEAHAVQLLKPAADADRVEAPFPQVFSGEAEGGVLIDFFNQRLQPVGGGAEGDERATDLAFPVAVREGGFGIGEVFDILRPGFAGRTGGPAENPGGADGGNEDAFKAAVPLDQGGIHRLPVRQRFGFGNWLICLFHLGKSCNIW